MKKLFFAYLFSMALVLPSCGVSNNDDLPVKELQVEKRITHFNDSIFFRYITDIEVHDDNLYLSDYSSSKIFKLDKSINYLSSFGQQGDGPSDINGAAGLFIDETGIYVKDEGHQSIKNYDFNGNFNFQIKGVSLNNNDFFVENYTVYGSEYHRGLPPMFSYDFRDSSSLVHFGLEERVFDKINNNKPRILRVGKMNNVIVAIGDNDPTIEFYNQSHDMVFQRSLSDLAEFQDYINAKYEKQLMDNKIVSSFFSQMKIVDNYLYLLMATYDSKGGKDLSNKILVCEIVNENEVLLKNILQLNNNNLEVWYSTFAVFENKIIAFDALSYEIHKFSF